VVQVTGRLFKASSSLVASINDNSDMLITSGCVEISSKHSRGPDSYGMVTKQTSSIGQDWLDTLMPPSLALAKDF
jgi:hypothetical protein